MGIGASVFLIAVGAILAWAIEVSVSGVDLTAVGYILMLAGLIGLIVALVMVNGWGRGVRSSTIVEDDYDEPVGRRVVRRRSYLD